MTPEKQFNPAELAALDAVLTSDKWRETCGLDEWSMYGELAMDVAAAAIAAEREACAKIAENDTSFMMLQDFGMQTVTTQVRVNIAAAIRARGTT